MKTKETEIKFLISRQDVDVFASMGIVSSSGKKTLVYYDDVRGKFKSQRVTYRRTVSKGVIIDEIKTLSHWNDTKRVCIETQAPALDQECLSVDSLSESDMSTDVAQIVKEIAGADFILKKAESVDFFRQKIYIDSLDATFDVDQCVSDNGVTFCEIELESDDDELLRQAEEFIVKACSSAKKSVLSKRERVRTTA